MCAKLVLVHNKVSRRLTFVIRPDVHSNLPSNWAPETPVPKRDSDSAIYFTHQILEYVNVPTMPWEELISLVNTFRKMGAISIFDNSLKNVTLVLSTKQKSHKIKRIVPQLLMRTVITRHPPRNWSRVHRAAKKTHFSTLPCKRN